jgi:pimeloyl-ACP methyl ester carboxylesterase
VCTDSLATDELNWQCDVELGDWRAGGASLGDATVASFDALDELLLRIEAPDVFPNLKTVVIAGHSAGGQFVTNYQMTNRVHERLRVPPTYVTANASAYAYPEPQRPVAVQDCPGYAKWPFGVASRTGYVARPSANEIAEHAAHRPIVYLVGELDTQTLDGGFYGSCAGMAQGATRRARGVAFADYMIKRYGQGQAAVVVPGCAHSESCMLLSRAGLAAILP